MTGAGLRTAPDRPAAAGDEGGRRARRLVEAAREPLRAQESFAASLFLGRAPWDLVVPIPAPPPEEAVQAGAFLADLREFLRDAVDADAIDAAGEIPDAVVDGLAARGAFGIKIPREYGGLGLSQTAYSRAAMLLGSHCGSTTALVSAHQSIGVPQPLLLFGTEEQKRRWLPRLARGEISAFALTEEDAGSDPARLRTRAEPTPDGRAFVLRGRKLWCTNGTRASLLVVMARTPAGPGDGADGGRITAFVVDASASGVRVERRCHFMGLRAIYNGVIRFDGVVVPREDILGGEGRGLKVALATLNTGRLTLPAACTGLAKRCLGISRRWAAERTQWGAPIGRHEFVADKLARMAASTYAMESITLLASGLVDRGADVRVEAAMAKLWCTEAGWGIVNDALQIRGGRGYETADSLRERGEPAIPLERFLRDSRINTIFEGSSEILRLFLAREALDPYAAVAEAAMAPGVPAARRLRVLARAGLSLAAWYPSTWIPVPRARPFRGPLDSWARWVEGASRRLARGLFHALLRHGRGLEREQLLLGRLVDAGTELFAVAAVLARTRALVVLGTPEATLLPVVELFCRGARSRVERSLRGRPRAEEAARRALAPAVLAGALRWLEEGIVEDAR